MSKLDELRTAGADLHALLKGVKKGTRKKGSQDWVKIGRSYHKRRTTEPTPAWIGESGLSDHAKQTLAAGHAAGFVHEPPPPTAHAGRLAHLGIPASQHWQHAGEACHGSDGSCSECGVLLDDCGACGGVGYHRPGCSEADSD